MKISKLTISNTKSFNDAQPINFDKQFNILIGPNGGGKSNLLDIITIVLRKYFLLSYRINEGRDNELTFWDLSSNDPFSQIGKHLEKFIGNSSESSIDICFIVTDGDIQNIKVIKNNKEHLEQKLNKYRNKPILNLDFCSKWDFRKLKSGQEISYKVHNHNLVNPGNNSKEIIFLEYLKFLELFIILSEEIEELNIRPVYLYFSPNRGTGQQLIEANLSSENYRDLLISYFSSTSRNQTILLQIAANYFAAKRRRYEGDKIVGYESKWNNDEEVKLVTKYLNRINYSWSLEQIDDRKNIYKINLKKDGKNFSIDQASSGEKEIINFLLGIFAFNIKYGAIIIDEPELHLHPKWQTILTDLFMELSNQNETDNQFILSTHSPTFISKNTVSKTIRIHKNEENSSRVVCFSGTELGSIKDLLHIVNSHNNEKIFFADKVVLVEGIHDRVIYDALIKHNLQNSPQIIEVVEVHGKHNLQKYRNFLNGFEINNYILADLDYLKQIGTDDIKSCFVTNNSKIEEILQDIKSKDRITVVEFLDSAIKENDLSNLKKLWEYIKSREVSLKNNLTKDQLDTIKKEINNFQTKEKVLVLNNGSIENYLPDGHKTLEKSLDLIKDTNISKLVESIKKTDLKNKIDFILS